MKFLDKTILILRQLLIYLFFRKKIYNNVFYDLEINLFQIFSFKKIPSIIIFTIPKSGSQSVAYTLIDILKLSRKTVSSELHWSIDKISLSKINKIKKYNHLVFDHIPFSKDVCEVLSKHEAFDKLVVHIRDPRNALISWINWVQHEIKRNHFDEKSKFYLKLHPRPKMSIFKDNDSKQIKDYFIKNYYPQFVSWIEKWDTFASENSLKKKILFVKYENFCKDPLNYLNKIFTFYDIKDIDLPKRFKNKFFIHKITNKTSNYMNYFSEQEKVKLYEKSKYILDKYYK